MNPLIEEIQDLKKSNNYLIVSFVCLVIGFSMTRYENYRLKKDIVTISQDVADRQHKLDKWVDFNKSYIPETALPRIPEIEAIYMEERK